MNSLNQYFVCIIPRTNGLIKTVPKRMNLDVIALLFERYVSIRFYVRSNICTGSFIPVYVPGVPVGVFTDTARNAP